MMLAEDWWRRFYVKGIPHAGTLQQNTEEVNAEFHNPFVKMTENKFFYMICSKLSIAYLIFVLK